MLMVRSFLYIFLLAFAGVAIASCPTPQMITQNPQGYNFWQAPYYQGFGNNIQEKAVVDHFVKAVWVPYKTKQYCANAYVLCYYKVRKAGAKKGHGILKNAQLMLAQNTYDVHVPKPTIGQWTLQQEKVGQVLVCTESSGACEFQYPSGANSVGNHKCATNEKPPNLPNDPLAILLKWGHANLMG